MTKSKGGWLRGRPRKLRQVATRRVSVPLDADHDDALRRLRAAHPELISEADVVRWAIAHAPEDGA